LTVRQGRARLALSAWTTGKSDMDRIDDIIDAYTGANREATIRALRDAGLRQAEIASTLREIDDDMAEDAAAAAYGEL
jgi:hypothetical protein